ncbi:MAG: hypothetical protein ACKVPJ_01975 [Chitinophagales bacterium]
MEPFKPYIWANENANPKIITSMVNCSGGIGNFDLMFVSSQVNPVNSQQLLVKYQLIAGSGGIMSRDLVLNSASGYTSQSEVKIEIYTSGAVPALKGMNVVHMNMSGFSANPNKPMCWIRNNPAGGSKDVFFRVNGLSEQIPSNPTSIQQMPGQNKVILYYDMNGGTGGDYERSYNLANYGAYPFVEVQIRDATKTVTKGKGTTDQNDADSP